MEDPNSPDPFNFPALGVLGLFFKTGETNRQETARKLSTWYETTQA